MSQGKSVIKEQFDALAKVAVIGDSAVGKTSLLLRYVNADYQPNHITTIGIDFKVKTVNLDGFKIKLQVWDTAGQERFRNLTSTIYQGAEAIILTYSIDCRPSFQNVTRWLEDIRSFAKPNTVLALVANKSDLDQRVVTQMEGKAAADKINAIFFETSAKTNSNVNELFQTVAHAIKNKVLQQSKENEKKEDGIKNKPNESIKITAPKEPLKKKKCEC